MHGRAARAMGVRGSMMSGMLGLLLGREMVPPSIRVSCARGGPGRERFGGECGVSVGKAGEFFWIFGGGAAPKVSSRCWLPVVREMVRRADPTGL